MCRCSLNSSACRATRSTTRRDCSRISSSTTVCIGSTRATTGTRVPGTTDRGAWWRRRMYPSSSFAYPFGTTAVLPRTSAGGRPMRRRAGASTGAMRGRSIEAGGTSGTAGPLRLRRRCPHTNGDIRPIGIRRLSSNRCFAVRTTTTSRATRWFASAFSSRRPKSRQRHRRANRKPLRPPSARSRRSRVANLFAGQNRSRPPLSRKHPRFTIRGSSRSR